MPVICKRLGRCVALARSPGCTLTTEQQNLQPVMSDSSDSEDEAEPVKTKKRKRKAPKKAITVEETTTEVKKLSNRAKKALRREV